MEVDAAYSHGYLPAEMHQHYDQPHPHPAGDSDLWEYFPCPFCYIEVEVPFLCNHLQEEHCFDTKNAVCPMCAENLGKDMAAHFRIQHSHLLKRRKSCKPSSWPTATVSPSEKEAYQVNSYHEVPPHYMSTPDPDPLLSQFICNFAQIDTDSGEANNKWGNDQGFLGSNQCVTDDTAKLKLEERWQRIEFLKEILMSTIS